MTFENLNLIQPLLNAVNKKGYLNPTPIQEKAIPIILQGKDILDAHKRAPAKPLHSRYRSYNCLKPKKTATSAGLSGL